MSVSYRQRRHALQYCWAWRGCLDETRMCDHIRCIIRAPRCANPLWIDLDITHPIHSNLVRINEAVQRAVSLVHGLEAFGRHQLLQHRELNLNDLISSLPARLRFFLPQRVNLSLLLRAERPIVYGDRACFKQVLMNIATNAERS
jgi:signal transduction histidine kinase